MAFILLLSELQHTNCNAPNKIQGFDALISRRVVGLNSVDSV
jgi:hypothetical protein